MTTSAAVARRPSRAAAVTSASANAAASPAKPAVAEPPTMVVPANAPATMPKARKTTGLTLMPRPPR